MRKHVALGLAAALAVAAHPAGAQKRSGTAKEVEAIAACRQVADGAQRLACYDAAAARLAAAVERRDVVVMGPEEVKETRRSLFGFSVPRLPFFGGKDEALDEVTADIASARMVEMSKWRIRLADGAIWETTEPGAFLRDPKPGQKIVIKRGTLGNYFLRIDGQRPLRGKRVS